MEIVLGWIVFSIVAGAIAGSKGRSGFGYFFLSLILSPLIGLLLAIGLPSVTVASSNNSTPAQTPETHVKCPDCRELVLKDARKCKHCGTALTPESDMTEAEIMQRYEITKDGNMYLHGGQRFYRLQEAIQKSCRS